ICGASESFSFTVSPLEKAPLYRRLHALSAELAQMVVDVLVHHDRPFLGGQLSQKGVHLGRGLPQYYLARAAHEEYERLLRVRGLARVNAAHVVRIRSERRLPARSRRARLSPPGESSSANGVRDAAEKRDGYFFLLGSSAGFK